MFSQSRTMLGELDMSNEGVSYGGNYHSEASLNDSLSARDKFRLIDRKELLYLEKRKIKLLKSIAMTKRVNQKFEYDGEASIQKEVEEKQRKIRLEQQALNQRRWFLSKTTQKQETVVNSPERSRLRVETTIREQTVRLDSPLNRRKSEMVTVMQTTRLDGLLSPTVKGVESAIQLPGLGLKVNSSKLEEEAKHKNELMKLNMKEIIKQIQRLNKSPVVKTSDIEKYRQDAKKREKEKQQTSNKSKEREKERERERERENETKLKHNSALKIKPVLQLNTASINAQKSVPALTSPKTKSPTKRSGRVSPSKTISKKLEKVYKGNEDLSREMKQLILRKIKTLNKEELEDYLNECSEIFSEKISKENFRKMAKISAEISELNKKPYMTNKEKKKKSRWSEALKNIEPYIPDFLMETLSKCP